MNTPSSTRSPMAGFPIPLRWSPLLVVTALLAACGGDPPDASGCSEPQVQLYVKQTKLVQNCMTDPEGEKLTITGRSAAPEVASVLVLGQAIRIKALSPGNTTVTMTGEDPGGQTASIDIDVLVPNRAPIARGRLANVKTMPGGKRVEVVNTFFSDPDEQSLEFKASSSDPGIATAEIVDSLKLLVTGVSLGTATVTVIAEDPGGLTAERTMEVAIVDPEQIFADQFESSTSLSDWQRNFASIGSVSGGKLWLYNLYSYWFGLADQTGLNVSDWEFTAAVGRDTESIVAGFMAIAPSGSSPLAFFFTVGYSGSAFNTDGDYRLATCCGWVAEGGWYGETDNLAPVGELNEITMTARAGRMKITMEAEELIDIDMAGRNWPSLMATARLAMYGPGGETRQRGFWDWAELWGVDQSSITSDGGSWHAGPPSDEELAELAKAGPWVKMPTVEVRK